jgi:hypothetical protein
MIYHLHIHVSKSLTLASYLRTGHIKSLIKAANGRVTGKRLYVNAQKTAASKGAAGESIRVKGGGRHGDSDDDDDDDDDDESRDGSGGGGYGVDDDDDGCSDGSTDINHLEIVYIVFDVLYDEVGLLQPYPRLMRTRVNNVCFNTGHYV